MTFGAAAATAGMASRTVAPAAATPPRAIRHVSMDPPRGLGCGNVGWTLLSLYSYAATARITAGRGDRHARRRPPGRWCTPSGHHARAEVALDAAATARASAVAAA